MHILHACMYVCTVHNNIVIRELKSPILACRHNYRDLKSESIAIPRDANRSYFQRARRSEIAGFSLTLFHTMWINSSSWKKPWLHTLKCCNYIVQYLPNGVREQTRLGQVHTLCSYFFLLGNTQTKSTASTWESKPIPKLFDTSIHARYRYCEASGGRKLN